MASTSLRSSSVKLDNIDDYLAPSQACVNPAFQPSTKMGKSNRKDGELTTKKESSTNLIVPRRRRRIVQKKLISSTTDAAGRLETTTASIGVRATTSMPLSQPPTPLQGKEGTKPKNKAVKASMADCLACSGCVTTAETVMMEERHSLKSLRKRLSSSSKEGDKRPRIVTISPNSWADMCRHWNLPLTKLNGGDENGNKEQKSCQRDDGEPSKNVNQNSEQYDHHFYLSRFSTLLWKILSVEVVVDGNIPLQWTWIDEAEEFCQIYNETNKNYSTFHVDPPEPKTKQDVLDSPPLPSMAIDSSKTLYYKSDGSSEIRENAKRPTPNLPLISGSCPALVCLVEKTLTRLVPHLSQSTSPMSLVGMILKREDGENDCDETFTELIETDSMDPTKNVENGTSRTSNASNWDHWAIMPCHDKKLEASRKDFASSNDSKEQAVNLVISTQECVELVEEWIKIEQKQWQQQQHDEDIQATTEFPSNMSVVSYLEALTPSDVNTTVLEPEDLLQRLSTHTIKDKSLPLLLTTAAFYCREVTTKFASKTGIVQNHQMAFSSGGHANFIFRYAAKKLFGCTLFDDNVDNHDLGKGINVRWHPASLVTKNVRSARLGKLLKQHYYETKLYRYRDGSYGTVPVVADNGEESSTTVLRFAIAHGMQTMQRALKQVVEVPIRNTANSDDATSTLHYLEAMACPHGCVNGGGSARSSKTNETANIRETPTETRQRVRSTLGNLQIPFVIQNDTLVVPKKHQNFVPSLRTGYHVVPAMNYKTGAVAGEKVENMVW